MAKVTLTRISSMVNAPTTINGILTEIESAFDNTLSRNGAAPSAMTASLDMNSQRILNLPAPVADTEPARKVDVQPALTVLTQATAAANSASASAAAAAASAATAATAGAAAAQAVVNSAQANINASVATAQQAATTATLAANALLASQPAKASSALALVTRQGDGLAIVADAPYRENIAVIDGVTSANTGAFNLSDWLASTCFPYTKMVSTRDGSLSWGDHNLLAIPSEDLSGASYTKTQMSIATGQTGPLEGLTNGNLLTASGTGAKVAFTASNQVTNGWHSLEVVAAPPAGAAPYLWIGVATVKTWFDLVNGATATVGANITANVYTTNSYGEPLANGYKRFVVRYNAAGVSTACEIGFSTLDNSTTSANGQTALLTQIHNRRGVLDGVGYLATTGAANYGTPRHWIDGRKGILIEPSNMIYYGLWSNDLTQADWTATNATTAFTQVGPDGTPCSLITATATNGTVLQTKTSALAKWSFAPYIKRVVGSGTIEITLDGGTTWTDVTSQIGWNWTRVTGIYSTSANPTYGFRVATSGNQFAVSFANLGYNQYVAHVSSPLPTFATDATTRTSDAFSLPVSKFNYNSTGQLYADLRYSSDTNAKTQLSGIGPKGSTEYVRYGPQNGAVIRATSSTVGGLQQFAINPIANITNAQNEMELSVRFGANTGATSVNGEPTLFNQRLPAPSSITDISINGFPVTLFSLVYTVNVSTDDALRTWLWSGRNGPTNLLDDATMARSGSDAYNGENREPVGLTVLSDNAAGSTLWAGWCPNNKITNNTGQGEWPQRTFFQRYSFNKTTKKLSRVDANPILFEEPGINGAPSNFAGGYGEAFIPIAIQVKGPKHPGRLIVFYNLDDGTGTLAGFKLNLYKKYTDDPMAATITWSSRIKVFDMTTDYGLNPPGRICPTSVIQLPASSANPYRIILAMQDSVFKTLLIYSDDGGDTWTKSPTFNWSSNGVLVPQGEIVMSYLPSDDSIALISRQADTTGTYANTRTWAKITGGGTTVTFVGALPGYSYNVAFGCYGAAVQADPTGSTGAWGRTYFASPEDDVTSPGTGSAIRTKYRIRSATDSAMTFGAPLSFLSPCRYAGYNQLAYLSGGYLVNTYETGPVGFNVENSAHIAVLKVDGP